MKTIDTFNMYHLGDSIFNIHFFNQYLDYDVTFNHYVDPKYIPELQKHIKNKNVILQSINNGVPNSAYNFWIGHNRYYHNWIGTNGNNYDLFYVDFFKMTSKSFGFESKINDKYELLFNNDNYVVSLNKNYDYLIVNSIPMSGQFHFIEDDFVKLCDFLHSKNITFITTKKIKSYDCTLDHNMSIVDIGNLSNNCKNVIGINTAPLITTFTKQNIDNVDKRIILDITLTYSYNDRIFRLSNLNDIYNILW
jgi:hypothetical protein